MNGSIGLVALAVALLLLSSTWAWYGESRISGLRYSKATTARSSSRYVANNPRVGKPAKMWSEAPGQSRGNDWVYEVFTPPVIYYDRASNSLNVAKPRLSAEGNTPSGFELLETRREPYRLQLVGCMGTPGDYVGVFASRLESGVLMGRMGHHFEQFGLTIKSLRMEKVIVEETATGPVYEVAAFALMQDEHDESQILLGTQAAVLTDTLIAVFDPAQAGIAPLSLRKGESFQEGQATCLVESIQLDPAEVTLVIHDPTGPADRRKNLRPVGNHTLRPSAKNTPEIASISK